MSYYPCRNPNCKSQGRPHPNCKCGPPDGYAKGGEVNHFCAGNLAHEPGCEYFAEGGQVEYVAPPAPVPPNITVGHAAVQHGLLGLFKDVGRAKLADPEKHARLIDEAKHLHEERQHPTGVELKKTTGTKLADHLMAGEHDKAAELMHGHPLVGATSKSHLAPILARLGPSLMAGGTDPNAMRGSAEYLNSAIKGHDTLDAHMGKLFGKQKASDVLEPDTKARDGLKKHFEEVQEDPSKLLDIGGSVGHYLPDHAVEMGALSARANQYFQTIKPKQEKMNPLDETQPIDKSAEAQYNRQLDIAQNPRLALQGVTDGTVTPQDVKTIKVLYPALYESMAKKASGKLIENHSKEMEIPYKQKLALSTFLGMPLDSTMTAQSMQAIMKSSANAPNEQQQAQAKRSGATEAELKTIEKTDSLYETPIEQRQMEKRE